MPESFPPQNDKTRICVEGFKVSHNTGKAQQVAALIQKTYPDQYDTWFLFQWKAHYEFHEHFNKEWFKFAEDHRLFSHKSSPLTWLEYGHQVDGSSEIRDGVWGVPLGGRDDLCEWAHRTFPDDSPEHSAIRALATEPAMSDSWVDETPGSSQRQQ